MHFRKNSSHSLFQRYFQHFDDWNNLDMDYTGFRYAFWFICNNMVKRSLLFEWPHSLIVIIGKVQIKAMVCKQK